MSAPRPARQLFQRSRIRTPEFYLPAGLALTALLYSMATLEQSSYWLMHDTAAHPVEAFELITNCWDYISAKPGVILALTALYGLFGPSPDIETTLLVGLFVVTILAVYSLTLRITRSHRLAVIAGLFWLYLPAQLYYSRNHLGYPVAWLMVGIWAFGSRRWRLAGLCLTLSLLGHGTFALPVGLFVITAVLLGFGPKTIGMWRRFASYAALPWLLFEVLDYAFTGIPFEWTRGIIAWTFFYQDALHQTDWFHVWEIMRIANGAFVAGLLVISVLYALARVRYEREKDFGLCLYFVAWGMIAVYTIRSGLSQSRFIPRAISGVYPLLVILTTVTVGAIAQRVWLRFLTTRWKRFSQLIAVSLVIVFVVTLTRNMLEIREFSRTGFPVVEAAFQRAARADQPVRYWGNQWAALFFAKLYGVEVAVDDPDWEIAAADTQAILVFEGSSWDIQERLVSHRSLYTTRVYPHLRSNIWPAEIELELPTSEMQKIEHSRLGNVSISQVEVWEPIRREGSFEARNDVINYVYYYDGGGCIEPPRYEYGQLHWYELVVSKTMAFVSGSR